MRQFAYLDDGSSVHTVSLPKAAAAGRGAKLVWIHLDQKEDGTRSFLTEDARLNDVVVSALTALETRPRCEPIGQFFQPGRCGCWGCWRWGRSVHRVQSAGS